MVSMRDHEIVEALHEPPLPIPLLRSERRRGCPEGGRGGSIGSWSQLTSKFFEVFALHDPPLPIPLLRQSGGEGARRAREEAASVHGPNSRQFFLRCSLSMNL